MRLPRIVIGLGYVKLWQRERKENVRLRRELAEWQGKLLQLKGLTPLFTPPVKTESIERPPVGPLGKEAYLARHKSIVNHPTAEQVLRVQ